jgi:hypothetical protein
VGVVSVILVAYRDRRAQICDPDHARRQSRRRRNRGAAGVAVLGAAFLLPAADFRVPPAQVVEVGLEVET